MKKIPVALLLFISAHALAQDNYWQQYLHYSIDAKLDDKENSITGSETIVYKNYSPDTLNYIWFHIYPNAYKDESTALFQQINNDPSRKDKIKRYKNGFISNLAFTVNNEPAKTEAHPKIQYTDIIKVLLNKPLLPGDSVTIATPFKVQLPSYFSRSGFADGEFMMCQWYPKPAVYNKDGWHEMPYLDMGEFYSEYASYKVSIAVPSEYIVSATGTLLTQSEADLYRSIGGYNASHSDDKEPKLYQPDNPGQSKELSYYADSVPDFAWFAEKGLVIQYDTIHLSSDKVIDAFTYYHKRKNTPWTSSIGFVKDAVHHYSNWVGEYAYPVVQAIEGPKNNSSGGMEYPMITLITSPDAKPETLDGVIAHEVGHNWFMSMLGTNERDHAWMDEGLNTYFQFRYEAEKYRSNGVFGDKVPAELKKLSEADFQATVYNALTNVPIHPAMETTSASFKNSEDYGLTAYVKTAEWMYLLEQSIGMEKVDNAFQHYFNTWRFKHPDPLDMRAAFEESIHGGLENYFALLYKEDKLVQ
ncbi:MAG: M1 family metallopeptidase [Ginsengibacter sp.]